MTTHSMTTRSRFTLDHITIVAESLEQGSAYVRERLGVQPQPGGRHPQMGTHNQLLRLGNDMFLEIIAIDPRATAPDRPRWFGLDSLSGRLPRLSTWVLASTTLRSDLTNPPVALGPPVEISRGDLTWLISIADDGEPALQGACPSLIQWTGTTHPAQNMNDMGCSLVHLQVCHPEPEPIRTLLEERFTDARVSIESSDRVTISAIIDTPDGRLSVD